MTLPRSLGAVLLAASLVTACGGGSTQAGVSRAPTAGPTATKSDPSYADGVFHGPGFSIRLPQAPKVLHKQATLNDKAAPVTFYDVTAPTYELMVVTVSPIVAAKGQEKAGLTKLVRDFWSLNGPAYQYVLKFSEPLQSTNLGGVDYPALHFDGTKKGTGVIWGQVVLKDKTLYMSVLLSSTKAAFAAQEPTVDSFLLS